jgi:hypothetical protein
MALPTHHRLSRGLSKEAAVVLDFKHCVDRSFLRVGIGNFQRGVLRASFLGRVGNLGSFLGLILGASCQRHSLDSGPCAAIVATVIRRALANLSKPSPGTSATPEPPNWMAMTTTTKMMATKKRKLPRSFDASRTQKVLKQLASLFQAASAAADASGNVTSKTD